MKPELKYSKERPIFQLLIEQIRKESAQQEKPRYRGFERQMQQLVTLPIRSGERISHKSISESNELGEHETSLDHLNSEGILILV